MPKFTAQHYVEVASILRRFGGKIDKDDLIRRFIEVFERDNQRFNKDKFVEACFDDEWDG